MLLEESIKKEILARFSSKKIAVLYGGNNEEREVSLRSGKNVYEALISFEELSKNTILIDVKDGVTLANTLKSENIDFCYNILHGKYGEDGVIQGMLDMLHIPYTGENVLVSALCMNKLHTKYIWKLHNIPTANFDILKNVVNIDEDKVKTKLGLFHYPFILKPISSGSSVGVHLIKDRATFLSLKENICDDEYLIEEYIKGTEITIGLVKNKLDIFVFPILGIYSKNEIYDYEAKYTPNMTRFEIPAKIESVLEERIKKSAKEAYNLLGCRGVCRIDATISEEGNINFMECNTQGGMTNTSDIPEMARAYGMKFRDIVLYILGLKNEE